MSPLLLYSITTDPFPLQASVTSGNPNVAELTIVATNNSGNDVTLQGIVVKIPAGQDSTQLTNDAKGIGPVAPENWTLHQTTFPAGFVQFEFLPKPGFGTVPKNKSLNFIFNNIQVNSTTGQVEIDVTEGSNNCTPTNCPIAQLFVTKFPNGWGVVSYWADHLNIPAGGSDTLHWSGPSGATYTIEYYDAQRGSIINVPPQGQVPLSNQGQYPAQSDPPLVLQQNTTFTLSVSDTVGGQSYHAQMQIIVTVQIPPPVINSFLADPPSVDINNVPAIKLAWVTSNVSSITVDGGGYHNNFSGSDAVKKSVAVGPTETTQYRATAYPLGGLPRDPDFATTWVKFIHMASSGFVNLWRGTDQTLWRLELGSGRSVFTLNFWAGTEGLFSQDISVDVSLQPGVKVADLGFVRDGAGYEQVLNGSYGTDVPMSDLFTGTWFFDGHTSYGGPYNVGATWGVRFSDGLIALLWFDGANNQGKGNWSFTFKWIFYNKTALTEKKD